MSAALYEYAVLAVKSTRLPQLIIGAVYVILASI